MTLDGAENGHTGIRCYLEAGYMFGVTTLPAMIRRVAL